MYSSGEPMENINFLEGVVTWGIFYLGMLVGGLLMVVLMSCFLQIKGRGR
jgi:hypothetical protein